MSEPQHIKEILPGLIRDIEARMKHQRQKRIVNAVGDFFSDKAGRGRDVPAKQGKVSQKEQKELW